MNFELKKKIDIVRGFNRFYTNLLGLLKQNFLNSKYSLSQIRILHEIEKMPSCNSKLLAKSLCIDTGYLSRIIKQFEKEELIIKEKSNKDARAYNILLTSKGKECIKELNSASNKQIQGIIEPLSPYNQNRLASAMGSLEVILDKNHKISLNDITIRNEIHPGDAGYITYLYAWIFKYEYDYSLLFEAYVAQSFYEFLVNYNPQHDKLWIAEYKGEIIGSIGIISRGDKAQLRWLILHPNFRGIGLGKYLLNSAIDFCKEKGFKSIYLDTTNDLEKAISMYKKAGFKQITQKKNDFWKKGVFELEFELKLN